jgi:hypothetical protein
MSQPPATSSDPAANYLVRHWRGELPLVQSFWLNGVLLGGAFTAAIVLLRPHYWMFDIDEGSTLLCGLLILVYYPVQVWQMVGISRAAIRYQRSGGSAILGTLAHLFAILTGFRILASLIVGTYW